MFFFPFKKIYHGKDQKSYRNNCYNNYTYHFLTFKAAKVQKKPSQTATAFKN